MALNGSFPCHLHHIAFGRLHTCDKFQKGIVRCSFHFREVYQKCIEYIGKFLIQMREISKFWSKMCFRRNFRAHFREPP